MIGGIACWTGVRASSVACLKEERASTILIRGRPAGRRRESCDVSFENRFYGETANREPVPW